MPRATYVLRDGVLIEKHLAPPPIPKGPRSRIVSCPMYISDGCEFQSQADGRVYTSKAKYRADLRARGLVEVGDDRSFHQSGPVDPVAELPPVEHDIKRAIAELS